MNFEFIMIMLVDCNIYATLIHTLALISISFDYIKCNKQIVAVSALLFLAFIR